MARRALVGQHQHGHHEDQHAAGLQLVLGAAQEEPLQPLLLVALLVAGHDLVVVGRVQVQEADRLVAADHILPGGVDGGGGEVLAAAAGALGVQLDGIAGRLAGAGQGFVEDRERVALAGAGVEEAGLAGGLEALGDTGDIGGAGGVVLHFAGAGEAGHGVYSLLGMLMTLRLSRLLIQSCHLNSVRSRRAATASP